MLNDLKPQMNRFAGLVGSGLGLLVGGIVSLQRHLALGSAVFLVGLVLVVVGYVYLMSRCSEDFTNGVHMFHKRRVMGTSAVRRLAYGRR